MRASWKRWTIAVAGVVALTTSGCSAGSSSASCAAKEITLADSRLHPGGDVQFSVDWMTATCEDTGGTDRPATNMPVTITPTSTGEEYRLGTVATASGPRFTATGRFALPRDLPLGAATLTVTSLVGDEMSATLPVSVTAH